VVVPHPGGSGSAARRMRARRGGGAFADTAPQAEGTGARNPACLKA